VKESPKWQSAVPYTILLGPNGKVLYKTLGSVDILQLRRRILGKCAFRLDRIQQVLGRPMNIAREFAIRNQSGRPIPKGLASFCSVSFQKGSWP
jgi:hypothetical protein